LPRIDSNKTNRARQPAALPCLYGFVTAGSKRFISNSTASEQRCEQSPYFVFLKRSGKSNFSFQFVESSDDGRQTFNMRRIAISIKSEVFHIG